MFKQENLQPKSEIRSLSDLIKFFDEIHDVWIELLQKDLFLNRKSKDLQSKLNQAHKLEECFQHYRVMMETDDYRMRDKSYFTLKTELEKLTVFFPLERITDFEVLYNYFETMKIA